jgi:hypothetical protein
LPAQDYILPDHADIYPLSQKLYAGYHLPALGKFSFAGAIWNGVENMGCALNGLVKAAGEREIRNLLMLETE